MINYERWQRRLYITAAPDIRPTGSQVLWESFSFSGFR